MSWSKDLFVISVESISYCAQYNKIVQNINKVMAHHLEIRFRRPLKDSLNLKSMVLSKLNEICNEICLLTYGLKFENPSEQK